MDIGLSGIVNDSESIMLLSSCLPKLKFLSIKTTGILMEQLLSQRKNGLVIFRTGLR